MKIEWNRQLKESSRLISRHTWNAPRCENRQTSSRPVALTRAIFLAGAEEPLFSCCCEKMSLSLLLLILTLVNERYSMDTRQGLFSFLKFHYSFRSTSLKLFDKGRDRIRWARRDKLISTKQL